ncbi:MAG TPA: glycosyltransferase family 39 protein [Candidatus Dormibacteraeota bacterium]|nr:glycosyltransferase family 39 protein [Candidatus Dormibacteraeota bacterium]
MPKTRVGLEQDQRWWFFPLLIALVYIVLHLLTASRYGYFRDALYYLACSEHLDWGYVDQPPLIALVGWISRHTLGVSLRALLFWPAMAGAGRIALTAALAKELAARRFGTALAAMLAATPGVWYAIDHQFAMNAFEPLFWTGCAYILVRMVKTENPRLWLGFGAIAGLGLQNKYSIAVVAFALLAGLLLTPQRKLLFTPWLFAGAGVALLIFLPNLLWNIHHHWPFLELMHNIRAEGRDVVLSPGVFLAQQVLLMNPIIFPFWFGGLLYYLLSREMKAYRFLGWAFVITVAFFMIAHGKNYYSAPVYPVVLAGAAVGIEKFLATSFESRPWRSIVKPAIFAWLILAVTLFLPITLPILPIESYLRFQSHLPFKLPRSEYGHMHVPLPQHYADEFGWEEIAATVATIYHSLPPEEQAKTAIFAQDYGQAGAIDFFGAKYGIPKAVSGHQNYFLWGPRNYTGEIVIVIFGDEETEREHFASVERMATLENPYVLPSEVGPIFLCRGLKGNLQTWWPRVKHWN